MLFLVTALILATALTAGLIVNRWVRPFAKTEVQGVKLELLVSPLLTYLVSDLSKDQNGTTFFCGGGRIAEMKVVTAPGITKEDDGGLWTPQEIADKMKAGEILLPD